MTLYWGDLHNHCAISYGHGSLARALAIARQQLDFCTVTGHAFWPDLPDDPPDEPGRYAPTRAYHLAGFARLHAGWDDVQRQMTAATLGSEHPHARENRMLASGGIWCHDGMRRRDGVP